MGRPLKATRPPGRPPRNSIWNDDLGKYVKDHRAEAIYRAERRRERAAAARIAESIPQLPPLQAALAIAAARRHKGECNFCRMLGKITW